MTSEIPVQCSTNIGYQANCELVICEGFLHIYTVTVMIIHLFILSFATQMYEFSYNHFITSKGDFIVLET